MRVCSVCCACVCILCQTACPIPFGEMSHRTEILSQHTRVDFRMACCLQTQMNMTFCPYAHFEVAVAKSGGGGGGGGSNTWYAEEGSYEL